MNYFNGNMCNEHVDAACDDVVIHINSKSFTQSNVSIACKSSTSIIHINRRYDTSRCIPLVACIGRLFTLLYLIAKHSGDVHHRMQQFNSKQFYIHHTIYRNSVRVTKLGPMFVYSNQDSTYSIKRSKRINYMLLIMVASYLKC